MSNPVATLFRIPELREKILFTLLILLLYRLGAHVVVPGINVPALRAFAGQLQGTVFGIYDMFVGGGLSRATVFALGIMPYISASIMFQLLAAVFPAVEKMQKEGADGQKKLTQYTRYATVGLSAIQGYGYSVFLAGIPGAVANPGIGFTLQMILTLTTGAIFVMWLGEQITERGIGNGMSLLIFFSIIESFPSAIAQIIELVRIGEVSVLALILLLAVMVAVIMATIAVTMASRNIPIQIPRKVMGRGRVREGQKSFVPMRLNSAGVMPIIFSQSIIIVPGTLATFSQRPWIQTFASWFAYGSTAYYVSFAVLIIFFTYFYTSIVFNPVDLAENLKKQGAFVPGVKPGARTAEYIDRVLTRISLPGALFLAAIAIFPFMLLQSVGVPFLGRILGGTGLLIVVGVGLDTVQQMQQHLLLRHYDGFMKRGRVKFRGRQRYI
ncbi:MAG: preprotein translocase subunit SecY [Gemmatimonadota bacterium]|jgi:preprotein translocase subunit SecY|nr:preprotein translocase subunit SecY [Gemmatimonadota bacterium]